MKNNPKGIIFPPPNVTGRLHLGHALQHCLMDIYARHYRSKGYDIDWVFGTDHAGTAAEYLVTKENPNASGLELQELLWSLSRKNTDNIRNCMMRLGISAQYYRERFTLDPDFKKGVSQAFVSLYQQGLIYVGTKMVHWDFTLGTAISDAEVQRKENKGYLYEIKYCLENGSEVTVSTTRPETIYGDTALVCHPDDIRWNKHIGSKVFVPLTNRLIPILGWDGVDQTFGTGMMKVTPAHDFIDYEISVVLNLPLINILDEKTGLFTPELVQGLDRQSACIKTINLLQDKGHILKITDHISIIPIGDRSGSTLEPKLTEQFFVKSSQMVKPVIELINKGELKIYPSYWINRLINCLEDMEDWCISRQISWGHQLPVWYKDGQMVVTEDSLDQQGYTQCKYVLDTWFSSALWPLITRGFPNDYQPCESSIVITGFDILLFWISKMLIMHVHFLGTVPFNQVIVTGLIRDGQGNKMSKTKGNVIDPISLIEGIEQEQVSKFFGDKVASKYSEGYCATADNLRFALTKSCVPGESVTFSMENLENANYLLTKLENVYRFYQLHQGYKNSVTYQENVIGTWIRKQAMQVSVDMQDHLDNFRFDLYAHAIQSFIVDQVCGRYIETLKFTLADHPYQIYDLEHIINVCANMLSPITPYFSGELIRATNKHDTELNIDTKTIDSLYEVVDCLKASSAKEVYISDSNLLEYHKLIARLAKIKVVSQPISGDKLNVGPYVLVLSTGSIDYEALYKEQEFLITSLSNQAFLARAPEELINKRKERLQAITNTLNSHNELNKKH